MQKAMGKHQGIKIGVIGRKRLPEVMHVFFSFVFSLVPMDPPNSTRAFFLELFWGCVAIPRSSGDLPQSFPGHFSEFFVFVVVSGFLWPT